MGVPDHAPVFSLLMHPLGHPQGTPIWKRVNDHARARFVDFKLTADLEKATEASITFDNEDFFWCDDVLGGYEGVLEGSAFTVQYGYLDPLGEGQNVLSPPMFFSITGKPTISRTTLVIKGTDVGTRQLMNMVVPKWYPRAKVSTIVGEILAASGFDERHRWIQDTVYPEMNICTMPQETLLAFLYRMTWPYNYRFYVSPASDGQLVAHFHKPGWTPSRALAFQPSPSRWDNKELAVLDALERDFQSEGNGNFAETAGTLVYRPSIYNADGLVLDSDVEDFSISFEMDGQAGAVQTAGENTEEGKSQGVDPERSNVDEDDLKSLKLSRGRPFNSAWVKGDLSSRALNAGDLGLLGPDVVTADEGEVLVQDETLPQGYGVKILLPDKENGKERAEKTWLPLTHFVISTNKDSPDKAKAHTAARYERVLSKLCTIQFKLRGQPTMWPGQIWETKNMKVFDQRYLVHKMTTTFSASAGLRTSSTLGSDGVNSQAVPERPKKPEPGPTDIRFHMEDTGATTKLTAVNRGQTIEVDKAKTEAKKRKE